MMAPIPPQHLPRLIWRRLAREIHRRTAPTEPRPLHVDDRTMALARHFIERQTPRFFPLTPETAQLAAQHYPDARAATLRQADAIRAHRFDLLGSGEVYLGERIDWHVDFKSGHRWPLEHHTRLALTVPEGGFDVKVPWELSRFHHAVRLGQAYLYTGDEGYAQEVVAQVDDWIEANPYGFGVNWAGPMDMAIRVVNWLWAYYHIADSSGLTPRFVARWLASLSQHGHYLLRHLEDGWPRTNHLIANLAGLAYLGLLLPEFPEAGRWRRVGLSRLGRELARQVYPDGVSYEASTGYHGLVAELGLSILVLCAVTGFPEITGIEQGYDRLWGMLDVIAAITQPDGLVPQIGDADDGRLHILTVHDDPERAARDQRHLLALAAALRGKAVGNWPPEGSTPEARWAALAGDEWQDALWCFPGLVEPYLDQRQKSPPPVGLESRGFVQGGLYVMQRDDLHLTIDAGGVGQDGIGGHAHNDTLGLTLHAYGREFLADRGSYLYTSDPAARNRFRSTAYHSVLQVEGAEINPLPERALFHLPDVAHVTLHTWETTSDYDLFDASHDGYRRLSPGIVHRRGVVFDRQAGAWLVRDVLAPASPGGEAEVSIVLWFQFAPLPLALDEAENSVRTTLQEGPNLLILPLGAFPLKVSFGEGWHSPRYGVRVRAPFAKFSGCVKIPTNLTVLLYPYQNEGDSSTARSIGERIGRHLGELTG
jgi:hypothetical protein